MKTPIGSHRVPPQIGGHRNLPNGKLNNGQTIKAKPGILKMAKRSRLAAEFTPKAESL